MWGSGDKVPCNFSVTIRYRRVVNFTACSALGVVVIVSSSAEYVIWWKLSVTSLSSGWITVPRMIPFLRSGGVITTTVITLPAGWFYKVSTVDDESSESPAWVVPRQGETLALRQPFLTVTKPDIRRPVLRINHWHRLIQLCNCSFLCIYVVYLMTFPLLVSHLILFMNEDKGTDQDLIKKT